MFSSMHASFLLASDALFVFRTRISSMYFGNANKYFRYDELAASRTSQSAWNESGRLVPLARRELGQHGFALPHPTSKRHLARDATDLESRFHRQYIQQAVRRDPSNIDFILQVPEQQDEGVWKYEHLRQFCLELNDLTVHLQVRSSSSAFAILHCFAVVERMSAGVLLADDRHGAVDLPLRSAQEPQGGTRNSRPRSHTISNVCFSVSCDRLYQAYTRWCCIAVKQQ